MKIRYSELSTRHDDKITKGSAARFYRTGGIRGSPQDPALSGNPETSRSADIAYYDFLGGYGKTGLPFGEWRKTEIERREAIRKKVYFMYGNNTS